MIRVVTLAAFLLLWEGLDRSDLALFSSPAETVDSFAAMVNDGRLLEAWQETIFILVTALIAAGFLGVVLGIVFGRYKRTNTFFEPVLLAIFMTPKIAFIPIIALSLGYQDSAKILVVFMFSFFEIFFTVRNGVATIDKEFVEVARAYTIPERVLLRHVILPATFPYVITGLRLGLLHGMVGVVLAGFFLENNGIGGLIYNAASTFRVANVFAALFTVMLLGIAINIGLRWLERRSAPWKAVAFA